MCGGGEWTLCIKNTFGPAVLSIMVRSFTGGKSVRTVSI